MTKRERFTTTLDSEMLERLKKLGIQQKRTDNKLLEEDTQDLLKKYDKKGKK